MPPSWATSGAAAHSDEAGNLLTEPPCVGAGFWCCWPVYKWITGPRYPGPPVDNLGAWRCFLCGNGESWLHLPLKPVMYPGDEWGFEPTMLTFYQPWQPDAPSLRVGDGEEPYDCQSLGSKNGYFRGFYVYTMEVRYQGPALNGPGSRWSLIIGFTNTQTGAAYGHWRGLNLGSLDGSGDYQFWTAVLPGTEGYGPLVPGPDRIRLDKLYPGGGVPPRNIYWV